MTAFARAEFALNAVQADGATLREHWQMYERQTGMRPDALNLPPMPPVLAHVWDWFIGLHRRRKIGSVGPEPLDDVGIQAWSTLRRQPLLSVEVDMLFALDEAYFESVAEARKGNSQ